MGEEDTFIRIPGSRLCEYLSAADNKEEQALGKHVLAKEVKKRKRSETPPEEIRADDEVRYAEQDKEQRSAQITILITRRNRQPRASQTRLNFPVKQTPSRFSCRVVTRHLAAQTEGLSQPRQQDRGYVVCLPCVSRRRDALCIFISLIVPLPLIIRPVSSLKL